MVSMDCRCRRPTASSSPGHRRAQAAATGSCIWHSGTTRRRSKRSRTRRSERNNAMTSEHSRYGLLLTAALAFAIPICTPELRVGPAYDISAQSSTASRSRAHVVALASDRTEGRLTGSNGERLAADYIITQLKRIGDRPLPGRNDYRLAFEFTSGSRDGGSEIGFDRNGTASRPTSGRVSNDPADVRALAFSDDGQASGPVVFAGYGIVVPESQDFAYDSYATLD